MKTIRTYKAKSDLGMSKPILLDKEVKVSEHFQHFGAFSTCNVWTLDGYLITAVQEDGITHHLRKGADVVIAELPGDQVLKYDSTKHSAKFGF